MINRVIDLGNERIVSGSEDGTVVSFDLRRPDYRRQFEGIVASEKMQVTSDFKTIYCGTYRGAVFKIDVATGQTKCILNPIDSFVSSLILSPDEKVLVAGFDNGLFAFMETATDESEKVNIQWTSQFKEAGAGSCISFSPSSDRCILSNWSQHTLWKHADTSGNLENKQLLTCVGAFRSTLKLHFFVDELNVLLLDDNVLKYRFGAIYPEFTCRDGVDFHCVTTTPERNILYSGSNDGHVRVHDLRGHVIKSSNRWDATIFRGRNSHGIRSIALTKDGQYLFTGSEMGDVGIWRTDELRCLGMIQIGDRLGPISNIHLAEEQKRLIIHETETAAERTSSRSESFPTIYSHLAEQSL